MTHALPTPDKGSIREIATGEITVSITPDDHLEGPYLLKTRELPGAPPPGPPCGGPLDPTRTRRIACFRHKTKLACSQSFIIAFSRVSGRYVKINSDAIVQHFWLALSARSISFFLSFLFSSQYNEQDHITSVTNTVIDILYRQTVIYQQCILRFEKNRMFSTQI